MNFLPGYPNCTSPCMLEACEIGHPGLQRPVQVAMTAPVVMSGDEKGGGEGPTIMQFLLPSSFTMETAPKPTDPLVRLREIPERTVAVHTFSGWTDLRSMAAQQAALLDALQKDNVRLCAAHTHLFACTMQCIVCGWGQQLRPE
mmetsp:Transcript_26982/g.76030  ORF Transcript_26982/g.76030 Transcript_26982/m.76030 type:complete len:144 (+) Transcript_26982:758-1189(+)